MEFLWTVTLPIAEGESASQSFESLKSASPNNTFYRIAVPDLPIPNLDGLISLSDDLVKLNLQVENVVKKIEKTYTDVTSQSKISAQSLRCHDKKVAAYLEKWDWDYSRFQAQGRPLAEIVQQIANIANYANEELSKLQATHSEALSVLSNLKRKQTINLTSSDFADFLTPDHLKNVDVCDSENLKTIAVAMNKTIEDDFINDFVNWGQNIASYGPPNDKDSIKGSPVVPQSAVKIFETGEQSLYLITILKGHLNGQGEQVDYFEAIKSSYRDNRVTVRDFNFNPTESRSIEEQLKDAKGEVDKNVNILVRWTKAHFGDMYPAYVHLRVINAYVESVLRYGVDNKTSFSFVLPDKDVKEAQLNLTNAVLKVCPHLVDEEVDAEDLEEEESTETLPYVCQKLSVFGSQ